MISIVLGVVGSDGGLCPTPKIVETIVISIVFGDVEGDWGPSLTPKIIENIVIPIVFSSYQEGSKTLQLYQ